MFLITPKLSPPHPGTLLIGMTLHVVVPILALTGLILLFVAMDAKRIRFYRVNEMTQVLWVLGSVVALVLAILAISGMPTI